MTSEAFKLKGLSEQVRNDFIKNAVIRLQERLAREVEERARKEAEEKVKQEELQRIKEDEAKALAAAAAAAAAAKAQAKAAVEAEARLTEESTTRVEQDALTQGESSTFVPLVLKTLEELQKEQQEVRARLDQQDSVDLLETSTKVANVILEIGTMIDQAVADHKLLPQLTREIEKKFGSEAAAWDAVT
ncbi:eukaryotic translation initiation factor 4 gamma-like [Lathyrus oleraceus]|uniref:eukaryotic translation initiation factor 4 gamma-like n=1 Tax=Pisum sativum TaxID=3888 RepID=UPI0021CFB885|nr:eukaryotic translation initiation factor 4 gamma-like [Pisum sativum]